MTADDRVQQISLVSQRNAENSLKNTIFIKPRNFCIPLGLRGGRTAILVWENLKNIQLSVIFPCAGLLAWTRPLHSALSLVNSNHRSCTNKQPATAANFLRPELPFDRREGWMGCRNYVALWIQCFYGDSLRCVVIRERFVGQGRLQSPAFLHFNWRNNDANNTEPKTHLKQPRIAPKLHKTQRQPHVKVSEVYFHIHNFILAFWKPKWISHTNSYREGHNYNSIVFLFWAWAACD